MTITRFRKGETVQASFGALDRDQNALNLTGATVKLTVGDADDASLYEFSGSPQVVVTDAPTGQVAITLQPADVPLLAEDTDYHYDVWVVTSGGDTIWQTGGALYLRSAIEPA